jgi:hypothetical protein
VGKEAITLHLPKPHTSASFASLDRLSGVLVHWARCAHLSQHDNTCVAAQKSIQRGCKGYQAQHHPQKQQQQTVKLASLYVRPESARISGD